VVVAESEHESNTDAACPHDSLAHIGTMTRTAHKLIKARRESLGLSGVQVSKQIGLSVSEYGDIEQYEDELFTVTQLHQIRKLCDVFGVQLFQLLDLTCTFCGPVPFLTDYLLPRNELVKRQRNSLGISQEALSDEIGFEMVAIENMELRDDFLENWSFELIAELAKILKLPVQVLLAVKCPQCKR
jgi:transcriptional regulator with XRE-family HTH domain